MTGSHSRSISVEGKIERADGALLDRGVGAGEINAGGPEQFARSTRFIFAYRRQVDIPPSGETVLQVPLALSVPHQRQLRHSNSPGSCQGAFQARSEPREPAPSPLARVVFSSVARRQGHVAAMGAVAGLDGGDLCAMLMAPERDWQPAFGLYCAKTPFGLSR